jgi:hypothetical protein
VLGEGARAREPAQARGARQRRVPPCGPVAARARRPLKASTFLLARADGCMYAAGCTCTDRLASVWGRSFVCVGIEKLCM